MLFDPDSTSAEREAALAAWLGESQPCLFGRIAARKNLLSYCILSEQDLQLSDAAIRDKIQQARFEWWRQGLEGRKHGFIVLCSAPQVANAIPDRAMRALAQRICSLYLLDDIECDRVHHDRLFLDIPGVRHSKFMWLAGVNYFSAAGDGRWWCDHRIPGGMAFSVNSVGHMVKSERLGLVLEELASLAGLGKDARSIAKVDSLGRALILAMMTIARAAQGPSGRSTSLRKIADRDELQVIEAPCELPTPLIDLDYCTYQGYYHTDHTLPTVYFSPEVERPSRLKPQDLDFTYLFDADALNVAHVTMGRGVRVGREQIIARVAPSRMKPTTVQVDGDATLEQLCSRR